MSWPSFSAFIMNEAEILGHIEKKKCSFLQQQKNEVLALPSNLRTVIPLIFKDTNYRYFVFTYVYYAHVYTYVYVCMYVYIYFFLGAMGDVLNTFLKSSNSGMKPDKYSNNGITIIIG